MQKLNINYAITVFKDSFDIFRQQPVIFLLMGLIGTILLFMPFVGNFFSMIVVGLMINLSYKIGNNNQVNIRDVFNCKPLFSNKSFLNLSILYLLIESAWEIGLLKGVVANFVPHLSTGSTIVFTPTAVALLTIYLVLKIIIGVMFLISPALAIRSNSNTSIKECINTSCQLFIKSPMFTIIYLLIYLYLYVVSVNFTATLLLFLILPILNINMVLILERSTYAR